MVLWLGLATMSYSDLAQLLNAAAALLKSLAWPLAAVTITFFLRTNIGDLSTSAVSRLEKVKLPGGIEAKFSAAEQNQVENLTSIAPAALEAAGKLVQATPAVAKLEQEFVHFLEQLPRDEWLSRLTRAVTVQTLHATFALTYAVAFGSQIKALQELSARRKVTSAEALAFFLPYSEKFPKLYSDYGFVGWIGFLKERELIEVVEESSYQITALGDAFLQWMQTTKLSPDRDF